MQSNRMEANRRLAGLLGWTDIFDVGGALLGTPPAGAPACRNQAKVPDWTGDWRDCGPLMVAHVEELALRLPWVTVTTPAECGLIRSREDRESADEVTRGAIVDAVIMKLLEAQA